jgi:hypothetical protein
VPTEMSNRRKCLRLMSLATLEDRIGYRVVAEGMLRAVDDCRRTGLCGAPDVCKTAETAWSGEPLKMALPFSARPRSVPARKSSVAAKIVPLDRYRGILAEDSRGNRIERTRLSDEALRDSDSRLVPLLDYWGSLRDAGAQISDVDPVRFIQMGLIGMLHLVNMDNPDPGNSVFELRGALAPAVPGTCGSGAKVAQHPVKILAESAISDYAAVRASGTPQYAYVRSSLLGRDYAYRRLIVPLRTGRGPVDRLLVGVDHLLVA